MPPKGKPKETKKTEQKKQAKTIEDKTFGLKNKKGTKQQKFVAQVEKQVKFGAQPARKVDLLQTDTKKKKEEKKKELDELNNLFKPVAQKLDKGVDPKSVVCAFYKQGTCTKGDKCKFSHDLLIERKAEKRSAYVDMREDGSGKGETMEDWDEAKLQEVVETKHGEKDRSKPKTEIICKFFVQALENSKYGWFWECPNGESCHYRHALPPGFVLKKDKKKMDEQAEDEISLEELIESERSKLGSIVTRITLETFLQWKKRKRQEKVEKTVKDLEKKKAEFQAGRLVGLSGRDMFTFKPELAEDDDEEAQDMEYDKEEEDEEMDEVNVVDINLDDLIEAAKEADASGTQSSGQGRAGLPHANMGNDKRLLDAATGGCDILENGVEINEDLFTDDVVVDETLFDLDDEVEEKLTLEDDEREQ